MKQKVLSNVIQFRKNVVVERLSQMDKNVNFNVERIVYYPYYFFEYVMKKEKFLQGKTGRIGCTIDAISGVGALIDAVPQLEEREVEDHETIGCKLNDNLAEIEAEKYVCRSISYKMKILKMPKIHLETKNLFYRPFWVITGNGKKDDFSIVVDAMSGKYHPL